MVGRVEKRDFLKEAKALYRPPNEPVLVEPPEWWFLMMDGQGDPNSSPAYQAAVEALFSLSYAVKFAVKRSVAAVDYKVLPLEGLWWAEDMSAFSVGAKQDWQWTMMIRQPEPVTPDLVERVRGEVVRKKPLPALGELRFSPFAEGLSAQVMHVGRYAAEGPTIAGLHDFIAERGYERSGKHHEIYLGDPRRSAPDRLKTVIRQPVARAEGWRR